MILPCHEFSIGSRRPRNQRAVRKREVLVWDDPVRVYFEAAADARTRGAGAVGRVEAEAARLELVHGGPVVGAAVALAVTALVELRALLRHGAPARSVRRLHPAAGQSRRCPPGGSRPAWIPIAGSRPRSTTNPGPRPLHRAGRRSGPPRPRSCGACTCPVAVSRRDPSARRLRGRGRSPGGGSDRIRDRLPSCGP